MIDLALFGADGTPVYLSGIAKRQGISEKYLERIFGFLHKAGLVKAFRGRKGGYLLTRRPDEINVNEIVTVLEGPCSLVNCVADSKACPQAGTCVTREIWSVVGDKIREVLTGYTLAALAERHAMSGRQEDGPTRHGS
jgi:Rrf2 family protein